MKIALIGASGFVGSRILAEALQRGHTVTALVRHPEKIAAKPNLEVRRSDVLDVEELARQLAGHGVVISAFNPQRQSLDPDIYERHVAGHKAIIAAVKTSGVKRLLAVGGAASLKVASGIEFLDSTEFPKDYEPYKPSIRGTRTVGPDDAWHAHGEIPHRQGPRALRLTGRQPDLSRRLCRGDAG
jgi:putative NADH-flavin reductase